MQKKIIALAVAGLVSGAAFAQSNVQISGFLVPSIKLAKTGNDGAKREYYVGDNTSRIAFSGSEDLGGGLKAVFNIETRFLVDQRPGSTAVQNQSSSLVTAPNGAVTNTSALTGWADGETWAGLQSDTFGRIVVGKSQTYFVDGTVTEIPRAFDAQTLATYNILNVVGNAKVTIANSSQATPAVQTGSTSMAQWGVGQSVTQGLGRQQNIVRYDSPNFGGFTGTLAYSKNGGGTEADQQTTITTGGGLSSLATIQNYAAGGQWYARAQYFNGPIYAFVSYLDVKNNPKYTPNATANGVGLGNFVSKLGNYDGVRAGGSYTFPFGLKVGLVVDRTSWKGAIVGSNAALLAAGLGSAVNGNSNGDATRTAWMLPVSYSFGNHAVYFTYAQAGNTSNTSNTGSKQWTLAYDYAFSKRTAVGVSYVDLHNKSNGNYGLTFGGTVLGGSAPTTGKSDNQYALNIKHSF